MGSSADAYIVWGMALGDMYDADYNSTKPAWAEEEDKALDDFEDEFARRLGWKQAPYPSDWNDRNAEDYVLYDASRNQKKKLLEPFDIKMGRIGHAEADEEMIVVYIGESEQYANWEAKPIKPLKNEPEWYKQMADFMRIMEIPWPTDDNGDKVGQQWLLYPYYG